MCFKESNNGGSKLVNVIIVFHDVNSVLYTVTNIYPEAGMLQKVITVFQRENLALFTVTTIHSIWKNTKLRNKVKKWAVTEYSRQHKAQTDEKTEESIW